MSEPSLLPDNASMRERAISEAVAAWYAVPNALLSTIWNPWTCPDALVPYLAWAVGVPFWSTSWTVLKQRSVVVAWIAISRMRGTRAGFAKALAIIDAELVDMVTPPALCALRPARTAAERDAYRAQFPEVRVYRFAKRAQVPGALTCGRAWNPQRGALINTGAVARAAFRAEYHFGDEVRPLTVRPPNAAEAFAGGYYEFAVPVRRTMLTCGRPWGGRARALLPNDAATRIYRYQPGDAEPELLPPGVVPFETKPAQVAERHAIAGALTLGRAVGGARRALMPSVADQYVYQSVRLYDPTVGAKVSAGAPGGGMVLGRSRLGMEPFRIEMAVDTSYRNPSRVMTVGRALGRAAMAQGQDRLDDVCRVVRATQVGRDKVMLKVGLYREIEAIDQIPSDGSFRPGQIIRTDLTNARSSG